MARHGGNAAKADLYSNDGSNGLLASNQLKANPASTCFASSTVVVLLMLVVVLLMLAVVQVLLVVVLPMLVR